MARLIDHQPGVIGWSAFGFTQVPIDGQEIPALGLQRYLGSVAPPTTNGHPIAGPGQIELGTTTLRQLGRHVGDKVTVGTGKTRRDLTIVGTVTLPSIGVILSDHVSLGRGAMLPESTLLAIQGVQANGGQQADRALPAYPSAAAIDLTPGGTDTRLLASRIAAANPDGTPGGTYALGPQIGAAVSGAAKMGSQPLTLALALAAAAVLSLVLTVLASVRRRRQELALLKTLGLRRGQVRAVVGWQTTTILIIAVAVGMPLGVAAGRWAWEGFANSIGVMPVAAVPVPALALGFVVLLAAGNLLAAGPATVAARIAPAVALRAE
jgi:predicted lysophospholipase L1 biosynthesis ABC-type transport system permease subunit